MLRSLRLILILKYKSVKDISIRLKELAGLLLKIRLLRYLKKPC
jgi:hypothetical protein